MAATGQETALAEPVARSGLPMYDPFRELLGPSELCVGKRRAVIVIDPKDRQGVRGCVRFPRGYQYDRLADLLNEYTSVHAESEGIVQLRDQQLFSLPLIYGFGKPDESTGARVLEYLQRGGFLLARLPEPAKRELERHAGLVERSDYWAESLPLEHPVFHSYFDLTGGLPSSGPTGILARARGVSTVSYYLGTQLIAVEGMPAGEFGLINLVIYALTRDSELGERYVKGSAGP